MKRTDGNIRYLNIWQCDPEQRMQEEFQEEIRYFGLERRGIMPENLVIQGHPLYEIGTLSGLDSSVKIDDSALPRVGVEWMHDEPTDDIGQNFRLIRMNEKLRERLASYRVRGKLGLFEEDGGDYEQISSKAIDDFLASGTYCESTIGHVLSMVSVTGWAGGNAGRKTAQWLYGVLACLYPFVCNIMHQKYNVDMLLVSRPEVNIVNEDYGVRLYGFEMIFQVRQLRYSFRSRADVQDLRVADIHLENSRSTDIINTDAGGP